jgi:hypothetical protein
VLYGVSKKSDAQLATIFAAGPEKAEPHFQSPRLLFADLFGTIATDASGLQRGAIKHRILLDALRGELKRMQGALAAPERAKLENYVGAIEEFEKRQKVLGTLTCRAPGAAPGAEDPSKPLSVEDKLDSMTEMAILALTCGMTNVVGVAAGCGMSHNFMPKYTRIHKGTMFEAEGGVDNHGHEGRAIQGPAMELIHRFNTGLLARIITALSGIKEGDRTAFDNTVMMYMSDNAEQHHADAHHRWPMFVIGDAGGKLKTGGRFLRYPSHWANRPKGSRSVADMFCAISTACGVPTDTFGKGGNEAVLGPLPEVLA